MHLYPNVGFDKTKFYILPGIFFIYLFVSFCLFLFVFVHFVLFYFFLFILFMLQQNTGKRGEV